jgi:hypothetical protein
MFYAYAQVLEFMHLFILAPRSCVWVGRAHGAVVTAAVLREALEVASQRGLTLLGVCACVFLCQSARHAFGSQLRNPSLKCV